MSLPLPSMSTPAPPPAPPPRPRTSLCDAYRRRTGQPFYRKPAAVAWAVILALALMLVLGLLAMG